MNSATSEPRRVGWPTMIRVLWRTFFLQAANNYERMQNLGFAYCMEPALARLYEGEARAEATRRHLSFFNSHPYLAAAVIGASIRLEEEIARGDTPPDRVVSFKRMVMGPLAAVGDNFFWTCLKPFGATWAIAGVLSGILWAPVAFLGLYNLFHLGIRVHGLSAGYRRGERVALEFNRMDLPRLGQRGQLLTGAFVGAIGALLAERAMHSEVALGDGIEPILFVTLTMIFALSLRRKLPVPALLYGFTAGCVALVLGLNALFPLL